MCVEEFKILRVMKPYSNIPTLYVYYTVCILFIR